MTISIQDHAAMRLSGRLVMPLDCNCEEYATVIVDQAAEIKEIKERLKYYLKAYLKLLKEKQNG